MFCMFGAHLEKEPNRFQRMKVNYPKQYDFCIRPIEENGLGLGGVMDYIGVKYEWFLYTTYSDKMQNKHYMLIKNHDKTSVLTEREGWKYEIYF